MPSVEEALRQADWWLRYAVDRVGADGRHYHPAVFGHAVAAQSQLRAAVGKATSEFDQRVCE